MTAPIAPKELFGLGQGRKVGLVAGLPLALTLLLRFLS
jgi:hypothetical protein